MRLGVGTDTDDPTGTIIAEADPSALSPAVVTAALEEQVGRRLQRPPAYSAKKVAGTRAYASARAGEPVELEPVPVDIAALRVRSIDGPLVDFDVTCGAGTYIRSIARDAGERLGVPAHLVSLRRTGIGPWTADAAVALDGLDRAAAEAALVAPLDALGHLPRIDLDASQAGDVAHGRRPPAPAGLEGGPFVLAAGGRLLAVGEVIDGLVAPRKVFHD